MLWREVFGRPSNKGIFLRNYGLPHAYLNELELENPSDLGDAVLDDDIFRSNVLMDHRVPVKIIETDCDLNQYVEELFTRRVRVRFVQMPASF